MNDQAWANGIVDCCCRYGIDHFFVAPGSRCTPLTLAIAQRSNAKIVQHFDERGLAFAALGYGRATGKAGVFVCTSGTAVANAYPAVIESSTEGVPLLLFTADRPDELRGTGSNQTIEQRNIFGTYPELFRQMPVPQDLEVRSEPDPPGDTDTHEDERVFLSKTLHECFMAARFGPVHVNWMFREPFTLEQDGTPTEPETIGPPTSVAETDESALIETKGDLLIALGRCNRDEAKAALELADTLDCPLLADITSGLRNGSFELPTDFSLPSPQTILHLGGRITSKSWNQWTNSLRDTDVRFIHLTPTGRVINPNRLRQELHRTSLETLTDKVKGKPTSKSFRDAWQDAARTRTEAIENVLSQVDRLNEPAVASYLCKHCPVSDALFIGNSMPIRDFDWYGTWTPEQPRSIFANRGASGIDGLLATAAGVAIGTQRATTVVLGDLSTLHDLNSLALVANSPVAVIAVIINNQSGHIFDLLPVRESQHFEQFFATPHSLHFEQAASLFGLPYQQITSMSELDNAYNAAIAAGKSAVLEIVTDRRHNTEVRQQIRGEILRCSNLR